MRRIQWFFVGLGILLAAFWLLAHPQIFALREVFAMRHEWVLLTGALAFAAMAIGVMLTLRPVSVEPSLGGLDKMYRLHKWLGITATAMGVAHWLWIKAPRWAAQWGWVERPARHRTAVELTGMEGFFRQQRGLAESIGEWAFYAMLVLVAIALIHRIPYRYFRQTHRLLALVALAFCWHAAVLTEFADWSRPVGWLTALLIAGCVAAAVVALVGRIGRARQVPATIQALEKFRDNKVLKVVLELKGHWPGHHSGQFAFVTFDPREGAHPFTISSAWHGDARVTFMIKGIGDYTERLPSLLSVGDPVRVEGPYGEFRFQGPQPRQIWIGAGIGITPFIARLQSLAIDPDGRQVDLFYVTSLPDDAFVQRLQRAAQAAGATLHLHVAGRDSRLSGELLREALPGWRESSIWFCGPATFGAALRADLLAHGMEADAFHQELFDMR